VGPHRVAICRPQLIPYERIAQAFIDAVELELPPCATTAVALQTDKHWMERKLWTLRYTGWLPKGASPAPGEDRSGWLAQARALLAIRVEELRRVEELNELRRGWARDRLNARDRERRSQERAARPSRMPLDRFALL
jgi:hypothetical protein